MEPTLHKKTNSFLGFKNEAGYQQMK
jgi:hypothetical protein